MRATYCWSPKESPAQIEFPESLLRSVVRQSHASHSYSRGILSGISEEGYIRLHDAQPASSEISAVGVYVYRKSGEVFLTEEDLGFMEAAGVPLALVVAGDRAGFFVRLADGTMETVQSYEEFSISGNRLRLREAYRGKYWGTVALGTVVLAGLFAALLTAGPNRTSLHHLSLRETNGQLVISWGQTGVRGQLEVLDGESRNVSPVTAVQTSATYPIRDGDIEVRLTAKDRRGNPVAEMARWVRPGP